MKRADKEQLVTELRDKLKNSQSLYYTDFTGLNVKRMTELRRRLKRAGIDYVVIKNTLALRAVNESGLVGEKLKGPTGLVVGKDPVTAARLLTEFAKENEDKPGMKGGMLSGKAINNAQLKRMASLPSRTATSCLTRLLPSASFADSRGAVPIPSIWPRASSRQASRDGRRNTQNLRLDEPALSTSA